jgi:hypothetical protein
MEGYFKDLPDFPRKHSIWNKIFTILEFACIPLVLWWVSYDHLPSPGWAVAFIAVAAAAMSVHDDIRSWQKGTWLLIIGAFLITERRAISKDRVENETRALADRSAQDTAFKGVRDAQDADFKVTADRLKAVIGGIDSTLQTSNRTLVQTQPRAYFGPTTFKGNVGIVPGKSYSFDVYYQNSGDDVARKVTVYANTYTGKPNDLATEKKISEKFEKDWEKGIGVRTLGIVNAKESDWVSFPTQVFSEEDHRHIVEDQTWTQYTLSRISYRDATGEWYSDSCGYWQIPLVSPAVVRVCRVNKDTRQRPKRR